MQGGNLLGIDTRQRAGLSAGERVSSDIFALLVTNNQSVLRNIPEERMLTYSAAES